MIIGCPSCAARYTLPDRLMGKGGALVRCPACGCVYRVDPPRTTRPPAHDAASTVRVPGAIESLRALDVPPGSLARAAAAGRLFSQFGPALLAAFEGSGERLDESPTAFLQALQTVAGIDLSGTNEASAASGSA